MQLASKQENSFSKKIFDHAPDVVSRCSFSSLISYIYIILEAGFLAWFLVFIDDWKPCRVI